MQTHIDLIEREIEKVRLEIVNHSLYQNIKTLSDVQVFMEHHVYAVFDFMSLLKSLQRNLTCTTIPWHPVGNANTRFLINEIVCGEESDTDANGTRMSHFEMYLDAMQQAGADTKGILKFVQNISNGTSLETAFETASTPLAARNFVTKTFEIISQSSVATQAAVFTYGREDLIPNMFYALVNDINEQFPNKIDKFKYYLDRHIEVDGDHHKILAKEMMIELLAKEPSIDSKKLTDTINASLIARRNLWSGIEEMIKK